MWYAESGHGFADEMHMGNSAAARAEGQASPRVQIAAARASAVMVFILAK